MKVYLVGYEYTRSMMFGGFGLSKTGIVGTKEEAIEACKSGDHFYVEWELGHVLESGDLLDKAQVEGTMVFPKKSG